VSTELSSKQLVLASQLSYASTRKQAAGVRSQCTLEEWNLVLDEAKKLYSMRKAWSARRRKVEYSAMTQRQSRAA
jgi:hypothetical protein